VGGFGYIDVI